MDNIIIIFPAFCIRRGNGMYLKWYIWSLNAPNLAPELALISTTVFSRVWLCVTPWTAALYTSLSMGFSRQEYLSELPCPSPGDLPNPGIKPTISCLLHRQVGSLPLASPGNPTSQWWSVDICWINGREGEMEGEHTDKVMTEQKVPFFSELDILHLYHITFKKLQPMLKSKIASPFINC